MWSSSERVPIRVSCVCVCVCHISSLSKKPNCQRNHTNTIVASATVVGVVVTTRRRSTWRRGVWRNAWRARCRCCAMEPRLRQATTFTYDIYMAGATAIVYFPNGIRAHTRHHRYACERYNATDSGVVRAIVVSIIFRQWPHRIHDRSSNGGFAFLFGQWRNKDARTPRRPLDPPETSSHEALTCGALLRAQAR